MYSTSLRLVQGRAVNNVLYKNAFLLYKYTPEAIVNSKRSKGTLNIMQNIKFKMKDYRFPTYPESISSRLKSIPNLLKNNSIKIIKSGVESIEYVLAYKIRRMQQMMFLYCNLWDEASLRLLVNSPLLGSKAFLICSVLAHSFNWEQERISDSEVLQYSAEMSLVDYLKNKRKACLDGTKPAADCTCSVCITTDSEWQVFVDQPEIAVWRREDVNHRGEGLYCYKVYGKYHDVSAYDFLEAQIDLDYRMSWDTNAVVLKYIESEPSTNSDLIYWEVKWPRLFSNRDYVFKRRYRVDKKRKLLFLANRNSRHPNYPPVSGKQRISEYWSYMVIKPATAFDKPGLEFSLTYFENPGAKIPPSVASKATTTALPDSMNQLRMAALGLNKKRGGKPSFLDSRDAYAKDESEEQPRSKTVLLEILKGAMQLF